jgi:PAS domain S-box-containing protein
MDIQLDGVMDGIATAAEIRRRWQIPVVFSTAFANSEVLTRAKATGPYGYITKPFGMKELHATVSVALQQHQLTKEAFQEHGWLRTLLTGICDGVIATDAAGNVKFLNHVAETLTGRTPTAALGRPIEELYRLTTESGTPVENCQLRRVLAANRPFGRERFVLTNTHRTLTVEASAAPIRDAGGQLTGAVTLISDVTEQQQTERERERLFAEVSRSNSELSRFSHTVAHDLRAPVRTVKAFAQLLERQLTGRLDENSADSLTRIIEAASNMECLIQTLLRYAQAGDAVLKRERVPGGELVAEAELLLSALLRETGGHVETDPLPVLWVDRVQFQQVFQNLLANSIQYRLPDQPPRIRISSRVTEEGCEIAIADNAMGIPFDQLERIFAAFTRLHGEDVPGTGLGLAMCRRIVERHGGRIWAESTGIGHGTVIRLVIPHDRQ